MNRFRLLIVDDEPLIRAGIRDGFSGKDDIEVAGECGSVSEAVDFLRTEQVDLVLLDVELPDGKGFTSFAGWGQTGCRLSYSSQHTTSTPSRPLK
jgi:DNA-binding NarL/FixJ family response regulator